MIFWTMIVTSLITTTENKAFTERIQKSMDALSGITATSGDIQKSEKEVLELLNEMASLKPYDEMKKDAALLAANLATLQLLQQANVYSPWVLAFSSEQSFLEKVPFRLKQMLLAKGQTKFTLSPSETPLKGEKIFIYGQETKLPTSLSAGRYIVHFQQKNNISSYKVEMVEGQKPTFEFVKKWTLSDLPSHVSLKNKPLTSAAKTGSTDFKSQIESDMKSEKGLESAIESNDSIWKSKWLWFVVGSLAAGAAGYVIYDQTRDKAIATP